MTNVAPKQITPIHTLSNSIIFPPPPRLFHILLTNFIINFIQLFLKKKSLFFILD